MQFRKFRNKHIFRLNVDICDKFFIKSAVAALIGSRFIEPMFKPYMDTDENAAG